MSSKDKVKCSCTCQHVEVLPEGLAPEGVIDSWWEHYTLGGNGEGGVLPDMKEAVMEAQIPPRSSMRQNSEAWRRRVVERKEWGGVRKGDGRIGKEERGE